MKHKATTIKACSLNRKEKICSERQRPVLCSCLVFSIQIQTPVHVSPFPLCFLNHLVNAKWFSLYVTVLGSSESRSQEKQTSSSLPSGQRCPWDSSCVCHQLSDQIRALKSVSSPAPSCRQVHGFALKRVAKQQCESLEQSAGTSCPSLT